MIKDYSEKVILPQLRLQNHSTIMLLVGNDFSYVSMPERATQIGKNAFQMLDAVIEALNSQQVLNYKINARYGTP